jgi:sugar-phosphatase
MISLECDAVLFDLDGVLMDSSICIRRHWQQWAQHHDLDVEDIMQVAHGRRTIETMQLIAPHLDLEAEAGLFAAAEAADTEGVRTMDGAVSLLNSLPVDGWAIVTSGSRDVARARLKHGGFPIPRVLVTAEDVQRGKPDPEPYLVAAHRLGMPVGKCVVVEDSPAGLEAACSAGMQAVAIAATHAVSELGQAGVIAKQINDIKIQPGRYCRFVIWIGSAENRV